MISGSAFLDLNDSKALDPGERVLAGVKVTLTGTQNGAATLDSHDAVTGPDGSYSFSNLRAGDYLLTFARPREFLIAEIVSDSIANMSALGAVGADPMLSLTIAPTGAIRWERTNLVVPDLSLLMFLASTPPPMRGARLIVSLNSAPVTFVEDAPPVPFSESLVISSTPSQTLKSAAVSVVNPLNANQERLAADAAGTNLSVDFDSANAELRVTGTDTVSNYQKVLRSLAYQNTSQDPDPTPRSIEIAVIDGNMATQAVIATIHVQPVNDAPNLAPIPNQTLGVNQSLTVTVTSTDPESNHVLTFQLDPGESPPSATIEKSDDSTAVIHWTPGEDNLSGPVGFRVLVTDSGTPPAADSERFSVTIRAN